MNILLVNPPWQFRDYVKLPPLGVLYLASYLRDHGHQVDVLDLNLEINDPLNFLSESMAKIKHYSPDIIGVSSFVVQFPAVFSMIPLIKKEFDVPLVLGGPFPTTAATILDVCPADVVVRGEGEKTFLELVECIRLNKEYTTVRGITYQENGVRIHNKENTLIKDLDNLSFPAYDLIPSLRKYQPNNKYYTTTVLATRGCPFQCRFCSTSHVWNVQRRRSPAHIFAELERLSALGVGFFRFDDDTFTLNKRWARSVVNCINELDQPVWYCATRIELVDIELLNSMNNAGCITMYHGIESGSPRIRTLLKGKVGKGITNAHIKKIVKKEVNNGIKPVLSFILGIPHETIREAEKTLEFAISLQKLGAEIQTWILAPYLSTQLTEKYASALVHIDKWDTFGGANVFFDEQRTAFLDIMKQYPQFVPDFWMFPLQYSLDNLQRLYTEMTCRTRSHYVL
jgi:radical SAM superfamily enzyme YgiQ (UPF0313 family)